MRTLAPLLGALLAALAAAGAGASNAAHEAAIDRAKQAIASGNVVPERDLQPLVDALRESRDLDDQKRLLDRIEWFGRSDGDLPDAARRDFLARATPVLHELGGRGGDAFVRGDALMALRDMGASRAVLEQAIAVADRDPDDYVKSRGEILRGALGSAPAQ